MEQIIPASDETTEVELKNIGADFCDPYVLLLRDDSSIAVLQADKNGELEPLDRGDGILASRWLSACLYKSTETGNKTLLFGLTGEGQLRVSAYIPPNRDWLIMTNPGVRTPQSRETHLRCRWPRLTSTNSGRCGATAADRQRDLDRNPGG